MAKRTNKMGSSDSSNSKFEGKENCKYQTIASVNEHFLTYEVMQEYETLTEARSNYSNDIDTWKKEHDTYHHFGIKELPNEK